jgi:ComF family protein
MVAEAAEPLCHDFGNTPPVVIAVPLHAHKRRQRGFNQSELIAREAMRHLPGRISANHAALVRHRMTESQTGLSREQRRANIRGAFRVARPIEIAGRDILLIDDVFTTGTTASECACVLRRAGASRVWVATAARVLKPDAAGQTPECEPLMTRVAAAHA